jgi:hypothetical protein
VIYQLVIANNDLDFVTDCDESEIVHVLGEEQAPPPLNARLADGPRTPN